MAVRAKIGGDKKPAGSLSFNDIIGHVPGRPGRDPAKKGHYRNVRNGNILVVFGVNPTLVELEALRNGKKGNKTGLTRSGMMMVDAKTGNCRPVTCDKKPDGEKIWELYTGTLEITGNPHLVNRDQDDEDADLD